MTKVRFTFVDVQGNPLPLMEFKILLRRASFNAEDVGVALPEELNVTTDAIGQVIVELWPLKAPYRIQVAEEYEELCGKLNWSFYVPITDAIVEAQTLFLVPAPNNVPWDEEAIGKINQAVIDSHDSAVAADASADRAEEMAQSIEGDADMARESAAAALVSENAAAGSALSASQSAASALQNKNATEVSAAAALASQNAAKASETNSKTSETNAKSSETNAATSRTNAANSATAAATSATNASNSAIAANTSAGTATTKAGEAVASANAAAGSASTANTKAGEASASAVAAKTSETNAKTSETNAANSATNASTAGSTAGTAAANAVVANKQDKHANLTAFSGLTGIADRLPYFTGAGALSLTVLTAKARSLLARTDTAGMQEELVLVPVTSNVDSTPGRLLTVNSFGVGGFVPRIEANTIDTLRDSGRFYLTAANGPGTTPGGLGVGYLDSFVYAATYAIQWFYTSDSAVTYRRVLANNVWSTWFKQDFGEGLLVGNALPSANANVVLPSGKYYTTTAWTGSPFTGTDNRNRGYLEVSSWGQEGYQKQEFTPLITAADNPCVYRTSIGAGFRAWEIDVNLLSALTDPALTAGGLMYYTSNANGEIFKFANGLMICKLVRSVDFAVTNASSGVFFGQSPVWTFPAAFVGAAPFVPCTHVSGGVITWEVGNIPGLTAVTPAVIAMQSIASRTFTQSLIAIGRWK